MTTKINASAINTESRCNTEYLWNEENTIRVRIAVQPGKMTLKLERHGGEMSFATRHGHTLEEVRARAVRMLEQKTLAKARKVFRNQA